MKNEDLKPLLISLISGTAALVHTLIEKEESKALLKAIQIGKLLVETMKEAMGITLAEIEPLLKNYDPEEALRDLEEQERKEELAKEK